MRLAMRLSWSAFFIMAAMTNTAAAAVVPSASRTQSLPPGRQASDTLFSCEAWLANQISGRSLGVDPRVLEQLKAAGVTLEPGRRMQAPGYPWEHYIQIALP